MPELGASPAFVIHPEQLPGRRWRADSKDKDGTMTLPQSTLGIDVSGGWLDVYAHPAGRARRLKNDASGIAQAIAWGGELGAFVVLEATAPFDQALIRALEASSLGFHRANPGRAGTSPALRACWPRPTRSTRACWRFTERAWP